jgi:putative membrane protein
MWPGHMWGDWGMLLVGGLIMLLFWGGFIALVFFVIRAVLRSGNTDKEQRSSDYRGENSLEILKQRYARGEISRDEYLAMRSDLEE